MSLDKAKLENLILLVANSEEVTGLGITKLYKLIFFCDTAHLREHGVTITGSDYIKYPYGPVPSRAEKMLKQLQKSGAVELERIILDEANEIHQYKVVPKRQPKANAFTEDEAKTISQVMKKLGTRSAKDLSNLSHEEPAWIEAPMKEKLDSELMFYGREEDPDDL